MKKALAALLLLGCGAGEPDAPTTLAGPRFCDTETDAFVESDAPEDDAPLAETAAADSACGAVEREYAPEASPHRPNCTPVTYSTDPPTSGAHYGDWAAFESYENPVPRGFYVHSMEHGAVILLYSCSDCADEVAAAQAMVDALPVDPLCSADVVRRVILSPDPLLEARWAAAAWGFTLEADCFEAEVFSGFVQAHYAAGPENVCGGGVRPSQG
jgi:hypothetical protein